MGISPIQRAALWMVGALISFMAMAVAGRELSAELNTFQILFFRSLIGLVMVLFLLKRSGFDQLKLHNFGTHLTRNSAHFIGQAGWFYGLAILPLAEVFAIEFTTPIWTALLAYLLLGEQLTRYRILTVVLGFIGILVILRPGAALINPVSFIVLISAIGYATAHTLTKKLTHNNTSIAILFYMTLIQLPMGLIPSLWDWATPSAMMWPWLIIVGATALTAHYCMANALRLSDATVVVPMDFLRLPLIAVVGVLFYSEAIDIWLLIGGAIIISGNWISVSAERRRHHI